MTNKPARMPLSALVLFVLAALALIPALMCFAGAGARLIKAAGKPGKISVFAFAHQVQNPFVKMFRRDFKLA